jgi:N-acetylmuramate 1-kinase
MDARDPQTALDALSGPGWRVGQALTPDCGHRRYWRAGRGARTAILVHDDRSLPRFTRIAAALRAHGFAAPEVYAAAPPWALLEDFGGRALRALPQEEALHRAVDAARALAGCGALLEGLALPAWAGSAVQRGRADWARDVLRRPDLAPSLEAAWGQAEGALPPCPAVFVHGDFHPDNLMALPGGRVGLLDFQDALAGPGAYDLVNLLDDARADVPGGLRAAMVGRYCAGMGAGERAAFEAWYRVLAGQFACRVAALFTRLGGRYAAHLPRLRVRLGAALAHPELAPVARWFREAGAV